MEKRTPPQPTILQLIPELDTGGAERGCVEVALATVRAGGRALVVSAGGGLVPELVAGGATHILHSSIRSKNPFKIIRNGWFLKALIEREAVDIIHARSRAPAWSGWLAGKLTGKPFMTTFHSTYNFKMGVKRLYNSVMARGARVIAISEFIRQHILENYRIDPARIRLIHRGFDTARFHPALVTEARREALRQAWGIDKDATIIMLPGRLTYWKGQTVLIEAMWFLTDTNVTAICVGGDQGRHDGRAGLEWLIAEHDLQGRVKLVGDCRDMPAALSLATIVVSASIEPEAFGRVIVEAQAMEKPVIVSDCGAVAETVGASIEHGGGGWIVPPNDGWKLANAIRRVLAMAPEEVAEKGRAARAYVTQHYTTQRLTDATLAVYNELLSADKQFS